MVEHSVMSKKFWYQIESTCQDNLVTVELKI